MNIDDVFSASQFGLAYERLRMEVASHNIAIANTPHDGTDGPRAIRVGTASFATVLGAPVMLAADTDRKDTFRIVNDPSHPFADAQGNVRYPDVNIVDEMTTLVSASRSYEANVRAINSLREMLLKALDIGRQS